MTINFNNVLVLAPHTDDGELGLGGTINYLIESGSNVTYAAFLLQRNLFHRVFQKMF